MTQAIEVIFSKPRPRIIQSLYKRLLRMRRKPIVKDVLGLRLELYPQDWIDNRLLAGQPYERDQLIFVHETLARYDIRQFFDCGSNIGLYSCFVGVHCPMVKKIYAFEPVPDTYRRLCRNLALNNIEQRCVAMNVALSDADGETEIAYFPHSSGTSTADRVAAKNRRGKADEQVVLSVPVRKLDDIFTAQGERIFIKLDVEGFEAQALRGMEKVLSANQCFLQVELWAQNADDFIAKMKKLGYHVAHQIENDYYLTNMAEA